MQNGQMRCPATFGGSPQLQVLLEPPLTSSSYIDQSLIDFVNFTHVMDPLELEYPLELEDLQVATFFNTKVV